MFVDCELPLSELFNSSEKQPKNPLLLKLNKKRVRSKAGKTYQIIRYDKDLLSYDLYLKLGFFRSLVLDLDDKKVVAMAPPKSLRLDDSNFKQIDFKDLQIQQFVEGTMINMFWDNKKDDWEITTRSSVGGNVKFYQDKDNLTFKEMFEEAVIFCDVKEDFNKLDKDLMYSFVLQHPSNRIVTPFKDPALYLIEVYKFTSDDDKLKITSYNVQANEPCEKEKEIFDILIKNNKVNVPKIYNEFESIDDCIALYREGSMSYDDVGVVFKHLKSNARSKYRNPIYEEVRQLKGNYPKKQYRYLALRKSGKMREYLRIFNEDKEDFYKYRKMCHNFTHRLFNFYVSCYMRKNKELKYFPFEYRTHMIALHKLYIYKLKPYDDYIRRHHVVDYFNLLHPSQQMFALNFNMRKATIDTFK